ncbi:MAG: hypothetical protein PVF65_12035 [Sphingomonadales bacterium]|jgi:hypothetical protein
MVRNDLAFEISQKFWTDFAKLLLVLAVFLSFPDLAQRFLFFGYTRFDRPYDWDYYTAYQSLSLIGRIWNHISIFLFLYGLALFSAWHLPTTILFLTGLGLADLYPLILKSDYFAIVSRDLANSTDWTDIFHWTAMTKLYPPWLAMVICLALFIDWLRVVIKRHDTFR